MKVIKIFLQVCVLSVPIYLTAATGRGGLDSYTDATAEERGEVPAGQTDSSGGSQGSSGGANGSQTQTGNSEDPQEDPGGEAFESEGGTEGEGFGSEGGGGGDVSLERGEGGRIPQ